MSTLPEPSNGYASESERRADQRDQEVYERRDLLIRHFVAYHLTHYPFVPDEWNTEAEWIDSLLIEVTVAIHLLSTDPDTYWPLTKPKRRPIPWSIRKAVFERDEYRCARCGGFLDLEVDHIVPLILGGEDSLENYQTLCGQHNRKKGGRAE